VVVVGTVVGRLAQRGDVDAGAVARVVALGGPPPVGVAAAGAPRREEAAPHAGADAASARAGAARALDLVASPPRATAPPRAQQEGAQPRSASHRRHDQGYRPGFPGVKSFSSATKRGFRARPRAARISAAPAGPAA